MSHLEELINKLNPREKAYFTKSRAGFATKQKKNYELIYDEINSKGKLDERLLRKKYPSANFHKFISSEKNYLFENILNALVNYESNSNIYNQLIKQSRQIEILINKGLRKKALKMLKFAKQKARKYEMFTVILLFIDIEEGLYFEYGFIKDIELFKELKQERNEIISLIDNLNEFKLLKALFQDIHVQETHFILDPELHMDVIGHRLLKDSSSALSLKAKYNWYYINILKYYLLREFNKSLVIITEHIDFMDKYKSLFPNDFYLQTISNAMFLSAKLKKDSLFESLLSKLNEYRLVYPESELHTKYIFYSRILEYYHYSKKIQEAAIICPEIYKFYEENMKLLPVTERNYQILLLIRAYIENRDYLNASRCIKLWNESEVEFYRYNLFKLYSFIIFFKLGMFELLSSSINSWKKTTKSKRELFKIEGMVVSLFNKLINAKNSEEQNRIINKGIKQLKEIQRDNKQNIFFEDFDFIEWFSSQLKS